MRELTAQPLADDVVDHTGALPHAAKPQGAARGRRAGRPECQSCEPGDASTLAAVQIDHDDRRDADDGQRCEPKKTHEEEFECDEIHTQSLSRRHRGQSHKSDNERGHPEQHRVTDRAERDALDEPGCLAAPKLERERDRCAAEGQQHPHHEAIVGAQMLTTAPASSATIHTATMPRVRGR